jgi:hypothetical protein
MGEGWLLLDGAQHGSPVVLWQMQVEDDNAWFWVDGRRALAVDKTDCLLTIAKQIELVFFAVVVKSEPQ